MLYLAALSPSSRISPAAAVPDTGAPGAEGYARDAAQRRLRTGGGAEILRRAIFKLNRDLGNLGLGEKK